MASQEFPHVSNDKQNDRPEISVNLMTVGKLDPNKGFGPDNSRLSLFERRLHDLISIADRFIIEVVGFCGGVANDEVISEVRRIIQSFPFPISVTFADGIVLGRRTTLAKSLAPLSFYWDDDCVFIPDALTVMEFLWDGLKNNPNVGAVGIRSMEGRGEKGEMVHCKPRPGLEPCCTLPPNPRLVSAEEIVSYQGSVIPVGIHGMGLLTYTELFRDVGGFSSFLRNQGEWGALFAEIWRQLGIPCLYLLHPEIMFDHQHVQSSPTRTMAGRFAESILYMIYLARRYSPIPLQDPLFDIGRDRYLKAVAKTYELSDLEWVNDFWMRLLIFVSRMDHYCSDDIPQLVNWLSGLEELDEINLRAEVHRALEYTFANLEALNEFGLRHVLFPQIKAFGELTDLDLMARIWEEAPSRTERYRSQVSRYRS